MSLQLGAWAGEWRMTRYKIDMVVYPSMVLLGYPVHHHPGYTTVTGRTYRMHARARVRHWNGAMGSKWTLRNSLAPLN